MNVSFCTIMLSFFFIGCTFKDDNNSLNNEDINLLQNKFKIKKLVFAKNQNNNDFFSESLNKCIKSKNKIKSKNTYTIKYNDNIISNVSEYQLQEQQQLSSISEIADTFLTTPRANFSNLCWEDSYTKPIYSKKIGTTLLVFSSNENYIFSSKNDSIKSVIENNPQNYYFDEIISIINSYKK